MEKSTDKKIGSNGEEKAALYLEKSGYEIIARNWRTKHGEVDIIVCKDTELVFVEVKTWPHGDFYSLEDAVGSRKQKRIIETAKCFLSDNRQYSKYYVRFDVLAVNMPGQSEIYHIENAFSENI